jgi:hypothetical protein
MKREVKSLFLKGITDHGNYKRHFQFEIIDNNDKFLIRSKNIDKDEMKQYLCDLVDNADTISYEYTGRKENIK